MHNHPSQQDSSVSDEAVWNDFVQGMLGELADPMTYEQAAKDAIAPKAVDIALTAFQNSVPIGWGS